MHPADPFVLSPTASVYPPSAERVRPIAYLGAAPLVPDVPALAESIPGYDFYRMVSCSPEGHAAGRRCRLNSELKTVPTSTRRLSSQTLYPMYKTPEQFAALNRIRQYDKGS